MDRKKQTQEKSTITIITTASYSATVSTATIAATTTTAAAAATTTTSTTSATKNLLLKHQSITKTHHLNPMAMTNISYDRG